MTDADYVLEKDALYNAVKHFQSDEVVVVGRRLIVKQEYFSLVETIQFYEYTKIFQLSRRLFAMLNAQCLIFGAFGVFHNWRSMDTISILLGEKTFLVDFIYSQSITVSFSFFTPYLICIISYFFH